MESYFGPSNSQTEAARKRAPRWGMLIWWLLALLGVAPARAANLVPNPILFVTQIPLPIETNSRTASATIVSVVSPFGNHLGDTTAAGRGGSLYIRYPDGTLKNLTAAAGFATTTGFLGAGSVAVRDPVVHWSGTRALFSMVVGAPISAADTSRFVWQIYEITGLSANQTPVITLVPHQPAQYNNISPAYGTHGRILFTSDCPRNGAAYLYPQREEYLLQPTVSGLWSLDPVANDLKLLTHTPSGAFNPIIDSFGRVLMTQWDHLSRDPQAVYDSWGTTTNGTFNYANETAGAALQSNFENYPEHRNFDTNATATLHVNGNSFNQLLPWQVREDGQGLEFLNHMGRHELMRSFLPSFTDDPNLIAATKTTRFNTNFLGAFFHIQEDPLHPGTYFGVDAPDSGSHTAGQILTLTGPPNLNPSSMFLTYLTPKSTASPAFSVNQIPSDHTGLYRNPLPMSDGTLVAVHTGAKLRDANTGTVTSPKSLYDFRIKTLMKSGAYYTSGVLLTAGLSADVTYFSAGVTMSYTGPLWELQPVEVRARAMPVTAPAANLGASEQQLFNEEGVDVTAFQSYLAANDLSLIISRKVTTRDQADRQQPYNLRIAWSGLQTLGTNSGKIYDIGFLQILQGDLRRGLTGGGSNPLPGRRVLATPLHDAVSQNIPAPAAPVGSFRLGDDGLMAAIVPARRALSWHLTDPNGGSVVKERYWLTFQPGEVRTCTSCHGLNTVDQANHPAPTNKPAALRTLLQFWKAQNLQTYGLTVVGGSGSGSYVAGTDVPIAAAPAAPGQVFDQWFGAVVTAASSLSTTLTMPAGPLTVTATYASVGAFANHPPLALAQGLSVGRNTPVAISLMAIDPDGDLLTYEIVSQPGAGSLSGS